MYKFIIEGKTKMKNVLRKGILSVLIILLGSSYFLLEKTITTHGATDNYYAELYRPQFHFSTPKGRLADPNGLVYFEGEYHLFHQKMGTWAHAVSTDLIHWEHLPIALEHDELGQAMSGTVVIDWDDTSGLFNGDAGMVAVYTSTEGGEAQSIAYSKDNGRTWERYEGNPVIENPGIYDFRDPKVFWHDETAKWVMVVSTDKTVTFYNSSDLIDWEYQSVFGIDEDGTEQGSHIAVWETPDFFPLAVDGDEANQKWVLTLSIGDNPVTEGSTNQYFIGEFDGQEFINDNEPQEVLYTDYGKDFYAGQSFNELEEQQGRRVWLGWMANWRYPYQSPTSPWMGSISIPRELTLRTNSEDKIRVFQEPISEIETIRATEDKMDSFEINGEFQIEDFSGISYEFELEASWDELDEFGIRLRQSEEEETVVGIDLNSNTVYLDRTNAGLDQLIDRNGEEFQFGRKFEADFNSDKNDVIIRGFVDESSIEIFVDNGEIVFTNLIYSETTSNGIELFANNGTLNIESLRLNHLHSIWRPTSEEDESERILVNNEDVSISVGESVNIVADLKPDWFSSTESFDWVVADTDIIQIEENDNNKIIINAIKSGQTTIEISHPSGENIKKVHVSVWDEDNPGYINGWGPSPLFNSFSGEWDILDERNVNSFSGAGQTWTNIYRKEILSGDFKVSSKIRWVDQGTEGFPKYGINIADQEGAHISGFFNNDINHLETNAGYSFEDIGWEGVELSEDTNLAEPQKLTIERENNNFIFYLNDVKVFERDIDIAEDVSIGLINENTQAKFTEFTIEITDNEDSEDQEDNESSNDEELVDDANEDNIGNNNQHDNDNDESDQSDQNGYDNDDIEDNRKNTQDENNRLPETATNTFNILVIGLSALLIGIALYFISRRKKE